jgi:hypothetical protein
MRALGDAIKGIGSGAAPGGVFPGGASRMNFLEGPPKSERARPISLSLNLDGRTMAQAMTELLEDFNTFPNSGGSGNGVHTWASQGNRI